LATTALLFAVVWVILGPILTGEVVLVQNRQSAELTNTNANARIDDSYDGYGYGNMGAGDSLTESVSNLYKWWTEQYPHHLSSPDDGYQTNYDETYGSAGSYDSAGNYQPYEEHAG